VALIENIKINLERIIKENLSINLSVNLKRNLKEVDLKDYY